MQLVVGLGNPGVQYDRTRHNVGFMVVDRLHGQGQGTPWRDKFRGDLASVVLPGSHKVWLLKPRTFMNLSGEAVAQAAAFYHIPRQEILVVSDDFALPLGKIRIRDNGSSGGHNGLTSVFQMLGGNDVPRLRVGVGPLPPGWDSANFVLGAFKADELTLLTESIKLATDAALTCIQSSVINAMNRFNGIDLRPKPPDPPPPS